MAPPGCEGSSSKRDSRSRCSKHSPGADGLPLLERNEEAIQKIPCSSVRAQNEGGLRDQTDSRPCLTHIVSIPCEKTSCRDNQNRVRYKSGNFIAGTFAASTHFFVLKGIFMPRRRDQRGDPSHDWQWIRPSSRMGGEANHKRQTARRSCQP